MKSKHIKLISIAIIIVFAIAILQLILGVVSDHQNGSQKADDDFNLLMQKISNSAARYEPGSPEFSSAFVGIMNTTTDIAKLRLKLDGMQFYEYPTATAKHDLQNEQLQTYSSSTRTAQGRTLSVEVAMYAMRPYSIYYRARISFILILVGTIASVGLLMYVKMERGAEKPHDFSVIRESAASKAPATSRNATPAEHGSSENEEAAAPVAPAQEAPAAAPETATAAQPPHEAVAAPRPVPQAAEAWQPQTPAADSMEVAASSVAQEAAAVTEHVSEADSAPLPPATPATAEEEDVQQTASTMPNDVTVATTPADATTAQQAVAPATQTAAEATPEPQQQEPAPATENAKMEQELAEELARAATSAEELSLIMIRLTDGDDAAQARVKAYLAEKLGKLGSVYLYDAYVAAVIRNTVLETALAASEALHKELGEQNVIGISARAGRDISAQRLIAEAVQAAEHTSEQSPIIAFRVDPEKYRKFVQENA